MTPPIAPRPREWWTRPATVLPLLFTTILVLSLLTPEATQGRFGDQRLSSHLSGSLGARVLADAAKLLGYRVVQRDSAPMPRASGGHTIHALLAPVLPITREEAHAYLEAVRGGDALLLVLGDRDPLTDSLKIAHHARGSYLAKTPDSVVSACGDHVDVTPPLWADGRVHLWGIRWLREAPPNQEIFATLTPDGPILPPPGVAATGFAYGKGRIAVVSDPDLLRNDVVRRCQWGVDVIDVAILEWLRAGGDSPRTTLAFDEYHQGFGENAGMFGVTGEFLVDHPAGRVILQMTIAGLILILALGPRPIPPQHVDRIERRDPLEQVDALAHAYQQVKATRTIVARLVRGLRWRVDRGASVGARPDEQFLETVEQTRPGLKEDVALVRRGLRDAVPDEELGEIGKAIRRIELTLTTRIT